MLYQLIGNRENEKKDKNYSGKKHILFDRKRENESKRERKSRRKLRVRERVRERESK